MTMIRNESERRGLWTSWFGEESRCLYCIEKLAKGEWVQGLLLQHHSFLDPSSTTAAVVVVATGQTGIIFCKDVDACVCMCPMGKRFSYHFHGFLPRRLEINSCLLAFYLLLPSLFLSSFFLVSPLLFFCEATSTRKISSLAFQLEDEEKKKEKKRGFIQDTLFRRPSALEDSQTSMPKPEGSYHRQSTIMVLPTGPPPFLQYYYYYHHYFYYNFHWFHFWKLDHKIMTIMDRRKRRERRVGKSF